ncbi:hypothetical protein JRQ81_008928 [Phrynocephalus forsythii]|uniref:Uncharacterized protein n=1 Tax=Phrynocephalus forsythii TaxID=171643 RepID=A0A9Q0XBF0_9SAUR|nr:hypothetical protein JRQ81_008928 [Phrynocephalus forsythii]
MLVFSPPESVSLRPEGPSAVASSLSGTLGLKKDVPITGSQVPTPESVSPSSSVSQGASFRGGLMVDKTCSETFQYSDVFSSSPIPNSSLEKRKGDSPPPVLNRIIDNNHPSRAKAAKRFRLESERTEMEMPLEAMRFRRQADWLVSATRSESPATKRSVTANSILFEGLPC